MGLGLKISIEGDKTLTKAIEDIDFKARSPRPFYLMFGAYMKRIVPRSVREQADPVTLKKWPSRSGLSLQSRRGAGGNTLADTGALVRSFAASPTVTQNGVSIGSSLKYALIHQKGGIIRAKKKYLTIPLEAAARKFSGIRAWFAAQEAKGRDPFFYRSKSGKVFAAYTKNKKTKALAFAWLLTPQVKIPQRRYLGFGKRDKEHFVELARQFFKPKRRAVADHADRTATLFDQIEAELVDALQPMLRPFDEDGLKQIEIEPFSSAEDIALLLQNFRSRIPGAYLNIPSVSYLTDPKFQVPDLSLEYGFIVGTEGVRAKTIDKKSAAYYFHDQFMRQVFFKRIVNCEIPATLHPIKPVRFEVAEVDGILVTLTSFSLRVSNWQIRELER